MMDTWKAKILNSMLYFLFPTLAFAANGNGNNSSITFTPTPADVSVAFLGNIFGLVDGVLQGNGSQIMGVLFGVFNSAVLALGSIIIMYTLIVSTMNTAQKGELLGGKWSSMWVPVRTTLGLALLIPKASGYCLMQVFVMWIVVQGIGAADQMWSAALNYLNQGGAIILPQTSSATNAGASGGTVKATGEIASGAIAILAGQVCMLGVQTILENARQDYLKSANQQGGGSGLCHAPVEGMKPFCDNAVPDFLATFDAVKAQKKKDNVPVIGANGQETTHVEATELIKVPLPDFASSAPESPYAILDGYCGEIRWAPYHPDAITKTQQVSANTNQSFGSEVSTEGVFGLIGGALNALGSLDSQTTSCSISLDENEKSTARLSRAIAIQQMYSDLSVIAQVMINNSPVFNSQNYNTPTSSNTQTTSIVAQNQFGVPYTISGGPCTSNSTDCQMWGSAPTNKTAVLFNGTEFQGAVSDYNATMEPTLTLAQEAANCATSSSQRSFIQNSEAQGWMLAGSYFFNLAALNTSAMENSGLMDEGSGLGKSKLYKTGDLIKDFNRGAACTDSNNANHCVWLGGNSGQPSVNTYYQMLIQLDSLITGNGIGTLQQPNPPQAPGGQNNTVGALTPQSKEVASTVYGYIDNTFIVQRPGQPNATAPVFTMQVNLNVPLGQLAAQPANFGCMFGLPWPLDGVCLGTILAEILYNDIIVTIYNVVLAVLEPMINYLLDMLIVIPLQAFATIFIEGVSVIQQPNVNPIVALANMGVFYINYAGNMWISLIVLSISTFFIGTILFVLVMPLTMAWLGTMVTIAFVTAYYVPFLPYMLFTFGSIAWIMAVIEAMVAAPIVALGVIHPEGEGALGRGEQALMILLNVFLRPAMMIIGYIAAISLSYVAVWIINAGFANVASFIMGNVSVIGGNASGTMAGLMSNNSSQVSQTTGGYIGWAGIYGFFFCVLIYTLLYLTVVQKSFNLIAQLPDKVLRWIGGQPESYGQEVSDWGRESQDHMKQAGKDTGAGQAQIDKQLTAKYEQAKGQLAQKGGQDVEGGAVSTAS